MDALIMDGKDLRVGGVIGVSKLKNPIALSRLIMEKSKHVLFAGRGAEIFAENNGVELIDPESMITDRIRERLAKYLEKKESDTSDPEGRGKYGTVGAIALDTYGNLAAATSTGGTLGKQIGRVGDTPIIGAGTYADEELAISSTGVGEYIIRGMLGLRVKLNMRDSKDMKEATIKSLDYLSKIGPSAVITLSKDGDWAAEKTTEDLVFACKTEDGLISFMDLEN
jgi:beta-aspartyl-peptidase (threonine type)